MGKSREEKIPSFKSIEEFQEFWDTHDVADYRDKTRAVQFTVTVPKRKSYFAIDSDIAQSIFEVAERHGSTETPVNLWLREKAAEAIRFRRSERCPTSRLLSGDLR